METTKIVAEQDAILAWHWLPDNGKLAHHPHTLVEPGQVLEVEPPIVICENGLHASIKALDALQYAQGAKIERVLCWGEIVEQEDKMAAQYRKCLWLADATRTLHEFAIWNARNALELAKVDDPRSWNALKVKQDWLDGKATDDELDAARAAARAAARYAAWAAAWAAARAEARAEARAAARDAALAAALAAARAAARDAALAASNSDLEQRLESMQQGQPLRQLR